MSTHSLCCRSTQEVAWARPWLLHARRAPLYLLEDLASLLLLLLLFRLRLRLLLLLLFLLFLLRLLLLQRSCFTTASNSAAAVRWFHSFELTVPLAAPQQVSQMSPSICNIQPPFW